MRNSSSPIGAVLSWLCRSAWWIGFIFIYLFDTIILTYATDAASKQPLLANRGIGIMLIYSAFLLAFITWRYHRQLDLSNPRHFGRTPLTFSRFAQLMAFFILMLAIQQLWSLLIANHVLSSPANQTAINQQVVQLPFWNLAYSVLFAPVIEELIFRGIFLNYFFRKDSRWMNLLGVLVSGMIFGWLHANAFDGTWIMYSALGWVLGLTYLHFRDIRYDIALHFMNNALSLI